MKILSKNYTNRSSKDTDFLGAHVTKWVYNYVCLFALAYQRGHSSVIRFAITKWIESTESEDSLIKRVVREILKKYEMHPHIDKDSFLEQLEKELHETKLDEKTIDSIYTLVKKQINEKNYNK